MHARKELPIFLAIAIAVAGTAQVGAAPVTLSPYGNIGQTRVFRGDLSGLGPGTVQTATIIDAGVFGGSDGVFSGFDLDFLLLDGDGDLTTTSDQVLPFQTVATSVTPGSIRNPGTSPYQPTASHPGSLFGLNADSSIDFATATIAALDASYVASPLAVDTSDGWVTLGDEGSLSAAFPDTAIGQDLWLFLGEAGVSTTEGPGASVDITPSPIIPAPGAILLASLGAALVGVLRRRAVL